MIPSPARCVRLVAALAALTAFGAPVSACSVVVELHRTSLWDRLWDWHPPAPADAPDVRVYRGEGPRPSATPGTVTSSSCDDLGFVELVFPPTSPEREVVGYAFEVVAGRAPAGLLPRELFRATERRDGKRLLTLIWSDGATDEQEPLSFVLGIRTVDGAGNKSREVTRVFVRDPGREG